MKATIARFAVALMPALAVSAYTGTALAQKAGAQAERYEELNIAIGESKTIPARGVKNFSVGVDGIADVRLSTDNSQFVVAARKDGSTTLLLIKDDGSQMTWNINVTKFPIARVEHDLQELLEGIPGIRLRRVGGRIFIEGGVGKESDLKRIQQIAQLYAGQVESLVVIGNTAADRHILVRIDFFYVKYNRNTGYTVGLGWPATIGGDPKIVQTTFNVDFLANTSSAANASIINHPLPQIDISQRHGWVKIFKQSTLVTSNGTETAFQTGVEANFLATNSLANQALVKISSGFNVTVTPRFDTNTREIELKVDSEVADFLPPQSGTVLPSKELSKIASLVTMKLGQALVLSGFQTLNQRHTVRGLPGLSQIPILGLLFGTHDDQVNEDEGAVFIIPSIIETVPKSSLEVIRNAITGYEEFSGSSIDVNSYNKTPPAAK